MIENNSENKLIPFLTWYQTDDKIFFTIKLSNLSNHNINIKEQNITFNGTSEKKNYYLNLELLDKINIDESKYIITSRTVEFFLKKYSNNEWNYIISNKNDYKKYITYNWDKFDSEDDNEDVMNNMMLQQMLQQQQQQQHIHTEDCNHEHD